MQNSLMLPYGAFSLLSSHLVHSSTWHDMVSSLITSWDLGSLGVAGWVSQKRSLRFRSMSRRLIRPCSAGVTVGSKREQDWAEAAATLTSGRAQLTPSGHSGAWESPSKLSQIEARGARLFYTYIDQYWIGTFPRRRPTVPGSFLHLRQSSRMDGSWGSSSDNTHNRWEEIFLIPEDLGGTSQYLSYTF